MASPYLQPKGGGILSYFAAHRTAANLLLVLMIVAGALAIPNMRAQFFPDVVSDGVTVTVGWAGAGAEDVDAAIVQILEPALLTVDGVTASDSRSAEGGATISLEFEPGADMTQAEEDVQTVLDTVTNLPEDSEDPEIRRGSWSDRVTEVVITGPVGLDQLARFSDELVGLLFNAGVTRTSVNGVASPSTVVEVPSLSLIEHDIGLADISAAIAREVTADPAGDVSAAARVRTGVAKRSVEDIAAIVLRRNTDGTTLTIGDLATVREEGADRDEALYVGADPAVLIRVNRTAQGDAIAIQSAVERVAREYEATLPAGTTVTLVNSTAEAISGRLALLLDNGLMGLALVVVLLFLFLNARTAFWVAAGIPVAMSAAIGLMYAFGLTFNMISLFALIITLGIVVDDAIVVGEHADFRVRRLGENAVTAAGNAARRMFWPVFSATTTTIIAFFGLVVIGGRFGDLISDIPFTVVAVLIASLVECFLILPNHLAHSIALGSRRPWYDWPSYIVNKGFSALRDTLFRPLMAGVIWARYPVLALAIVALASQAALVVRGDVQWRFFSAPEQGTVTGNFAMLPAATREDGLAMMRELQRATEDLGARLAQEHGTNPVEFAIAQIGTNSGRGISGTENKESWQLGAITISLIDADSRPYSSGEFVSMLQDEVRQHPLAETVSFRSWGSGPGGDAIDIQIFGADADTLKNAAEALKTDLAQFGEVSGLEDSLAYDKEELILELTPQGQALGFTIDTLGQTLRQRLNGIEAATYPDGTRSAEIRVELDPDELAADFLDRTLLRSDSGAYLPLADIVTVDRQTGFSTVRRENGVMLISVTGDLDDGDADRAAEITRIISDEILPEIETRFGVGTALSGLAEQEREFRSDALLGLILVLTGIYLTLAWIFASWSRPLVVMAIIPFGLVGAIWGHAYWDIPLSLFSVVGLIGMVGIIINDSIVLVTTVDDYAETRGIAPAIIDGAADRLRPVFLTTATTVLGLAPLLYEGSNQAEFLKPTVVTLVYGLGFGMVLVLLVIPALLAAQADIGKQWRSARRALRKGAGPVRGVAALAYVAVTGLFAAIVGPILVTGSALPALAGAVPALNGGLAPAIGLFLASTAVLLLLLYVTGGLATLIQRRRRRAA
jgi:multidrug efflux pump subunit AcrB